MKLTSPAFSSHKPVPVKYTCKGPNINPPLTIEDVPQETVSLLLTVEDVDATPNPWVHWLVYNIPPQTKNIPEGQVPAGATEGFANGGTQGYEGPCPIYFFGTHYYHFTLYALDKVLTVPQDADASTILPTVQNNILAKAVLIGTAEGTGEKV